MSSDFSAPSATECQNEIWLSLCRIAGQLEAALKQQLNFCLVFSVNNSFKEFLQMEEEKYCLIFSYVTEG